MDTVLEEPVNTGFHFQVICKVTSHYLNWKLVSTDSVPALYPLYKCVS